MLRRIIARLPAQLGARIPSGLQSEHRGEDRGERGAQLVGEHGEEPVLGLARRLDLLRMKQQSLLRPLAVPDVGDDGEDRLGLVLRAAQQGGPDRDIDRRAVLPPPHRLDAAQRPPLERLADMALALRLPVGRKDGQNTAQDLTAAPAEDLFGGGAPHLHPTVAVDHHDGQRRSLDEGVQRLVGAQEILLRPVALRHVGARADDVFDLARGIEERRVGPRDAAKLAVAGAPPVLMPARRQPVRQQAAERGTHRFGLVRHHEEIPENPAPHLVEAESRGALESPVTADDPPFAVEDDDQVRNAVENRDGEIAPGIHGDAFLAGTGGRHDLELRRD